MIFTECIVKNSRLSYFGDIDGAIGGAMSNSGQTQNGSLMLDSEFAVFNPRDVPGCVRGQLFSAWVVTQRKEGRKEGSRWRKQQQQQQPGVCGGACGQ
jgi:hypothetical protein